MTYASILVQYFKDVLTCTAKLVGLGSLEIYSVQICCFWFFLLKVCLIFIIKLPAVKRFIY